MSDLRNFEAGNSDIGNARMEPSVYVPSDLGDRPEPLAEFHTVEVEETSSTGRIVGSLAVALMLGAAAVYGYEVSKGQAAKPVAVQTAANNPAPVAAPPAAAPMQSADATSNAPVAPSDSQAAAPAMTPAPAAASAPVKKAPMRSARVQSRSEDSTAAVITPRASAGVPEQSAAIQPVQPIYPTAPSSAMATNNNQPMIVPPAITPDVQATPDGAPAPQAPAAVPAPADASAQPSSVPDQAPQPAP